MPTLLSHPAVPLAIGLALGARRIPAPLLAAGVVASLVPDLDVVAWRFDVGHSSFWWHRGATHSLGFAVALAALAAAVAGRLRAPPRVAFLFVAAATASHGLLDMLTTGGSGIALLWPLSDERFFFPIRFDRGLADPLRSFHRRRAPRARLGIALGLAAGAGRIAHACRSARDRARIGCRDRSPPTGDRARGMLSRGPGCGATVHSPFSEEFRCARRTEYPAASGP